MTKCRNFRYRQSVTVRKRVGADCQFDWRLTDLRPNRRLEPLAFVIEQRDQRDRRFTQHRSFYDQSIERVFIGAIQDVEGAQRLKSRFCIDDPVVRHQPQVAG